MEKEIISRNRIVSSLMHIGHGDLSIFTDVGIKAAKEEDELLGHFISWNSKHGEVRDSKVAFPILALRGRKDQELFENAVSKSLSTFTKRTCESCNLS